MGALQHSLHPSPLCLGTKKQSRKLQKQVRKIKMQRDTSRLLCLPTSKGRNCIGFAQCNGLRVPEGRHSLAHACGYNY